MVFTHTIRVYRWSMTMRVKTDRFSHSSRWYSKTPVTNHDLRLNFVIFFFYRFRIMYFFSINIFRNNWKQSSAIKFSPTLYENTFMNCQLYTRKWINKPNSIYLSKSTWTLPQFALSHPLPSHQHDKPHINNEKHQNVCTLLRIYMLPMIRFEGGYAFPEHYLLCGLWGHPHKTTPRRYFNAADAHWRWSFGPQIFGSNRIRIENAK